MLDFSGLRAQWVSLFTAQWENSTPIIDGTANVELPNNQERWVIVSLVPAVIIPSTLAGQRYEITAFLSVEINSQAIYDIDLLLQLAQKAAKIMFSEADTLGIRIENVSITTDFSTDPQTRRVIIQGSFLKEVGSL